MTIQSAIKSGKPFRRKAWAKNYPKEWCTIGKAIASPIRYFVINANEK